MTGFPAGVELVDARAQIESSILWNGRNYYGEGENAQIQATYGSTVEIGHSIVQGWTGDLGGVGNSGIEPQFVDIDGPDDILGTEDDNVRLGPGSPAINAGSPDPNAFLPVLDLDGHARVLCGRVDIGAYEFGIGDIDCNRTVNLTDFSAWDFCVAHPDAGSNGLRCTSFDFDGNGAIDLRDFAGFQRVFGGG